ncbi:MAG TPA: AMP-binding protein [Pirellulales bacterium]|nr:AMP-binding protein [Pirellulales bacterium]
MASTQPLAWVDGLTIGQVLDKTVQRFGGHEALVFPQAGFRVTYRELAEKVDEAARGLLSLDLKRGDHVALWATNVPQWVILQLATARLGLVLVTINPAYRAFELRYALAQCDAKALFLVDRFKSSDYVAMLAEVCPELGGSLPGQLKAADFPNLRWVVAIKGNIPQGVISWDEMCRRGAGVTTDLAALQAALSPGDAINIQYTSGTTGFPKAAMLSHRNLLLNGYFVGECQRFTADDRVCVPVPFYHCFGCVLGTMCSVVHGAAMIIPAESFSPSATLDAIERERATALYGVPTMFIAQLQDESFGRRNLSSLRTGIMSGSPCPIEVMKQVVDRMGIREITIAYGQTEASPVITQTRTDDPLQLRVETVGRPLPGVEVKLVDPATGQAALGDNRQGEICTRGHLVMLGYYKNPAATAAAIDAEGWLHTGDLGLRQPNGCYRITGRIKDMVIRGGENIYPREIEEFLFTHPAVEQVAVFGVPDPKFVEELCAWVKLKVGASTSEDELRQFCRAKLAHYKIPRYIQLVSEFPQTVTGKLQKFKMRELMIEQLSLKQQETA